MGDDIQERIWAAARVEELVSSCGKLTKKRDELANRLARLDETVDQLIAEKELRKSAAASPIVVHDNPKPTTSQQPGTASDAFKMKLAACLPELTSKAEDILELSRLIQDKRRKNRIDFRTD